MFYTVNRLRDVQKEKPTCGTYYLEVGGDRYQMSASSPEGIKDVQQTLAYWHCVVQAHESWVLHLEQNGQELDPSHVGEDEQAQFAKAGAQDWAQLLDGQHSGEGCGRQGRCT